MNSETNDYLHSCQDAAPDTTAILVLVDDDCCRDLLLEVLGDDLPVTVVRTSREARQLLADFTYRLVIVTSFGLTVEAALSAIPAEPAYPALLISGPLDNALRRACQRKRIRRLEAPFAIARLRDELAGLLR